MSTPEIVAVTLSIFNMIIVLVLEICNVLDEREREDKK